MLNRRALFGAAGATAAAALLALSGCSAPDPLAEQAKAGDGKNYVAGDGSVTEYAVDHRGGTVSFSGTLLDGKALDSKSFAGKVTVLNFWYAACAPCRLEAPDLEKLKQEFAPKGALFYGVNIRDDVANAVAFGRTFGISYPSFNDKDGSVLLSLASYVPPAAVPTTLVLDKQGRVAARILGVADKSTLKTLISSTLAEK
ncbi:thiol-disulfide isomerase/thioredoxin [Psychromicrobium silvestre]|uniref:Thiol-disulfide isomerase/thioredoxin n=1 Tax=Psychromicrobium silvestre TaxID=1645614 RepID=A0A7Y9S821_9MICC|nr:TlpA disulfide reductase family protein [Psychromicrobium silvestre]NYE95541.1 thiol-disulfide isomerase/thioredoxin [Psychromicrobium silvestre]